MLDIILGLILENSDTIIEVGSGILFGAATAVIAYKAVQKITVDNAKDCIRRAIRNSRDKIAEKYFGKVIETTIAVNNGNSITFDVLCAECKDNPKEKIKIESTRGVDSSLCKGMKITLKV